MRQLARAKFGEGSSEDRLEGGSLKLKSDYSSDSSRHVNFFEELEGGETAANTNKEREEEKKKEQEEYEKKIGLLTYLGQDSQELTGEKSWWQKIPESRSQDDGKLPAIKQSQIDALDPLNSVRDYLGCEGIMRTIAETNDHKKHKVKKKSKKKEKKRKRRHSSSSNSERSAKKKKKKKKSHEDDRSKRAKLEILRKERLAREKREKARVDEFLFGIKPDSDKKGIDKMSTKEIVEKNRVYSSQFNPQHARQNKLDANKKYWLE